MADIVFANVSFSYNGQVSALEDVSFRVESGERVGIIGPNGGGKTTALYLMLGFLKPQRGSVLLFNNPPERGRTCVGYVPQVNAYDKKFPISALDVVLTGAPIGFWGNTSKQDRRKAYALLERVGLKGWEKCSYGSLSGGQIQKMLIARALMCDPKLLLLDEPTANIDPQSEEMIFSYFQTLGENVTIVVVMHNFEAIVKYTQRILCFQQRVDPINPETMCKHFLFGMYHDTHKKSHE